MIFRSDSRTLLVSAETARALDAEARDEWGFNVFSLIEAAGRLCAQSFTEAFPDYFTSPPRVTVAAGAGNNGADAMVMLRCWILSGRVDAASAALVLSRMPKPGDESPWAALVESLKKMNVRALVWDGDLGENAGSPSDDVLALSDIIVDGISGTGAKGPLRGAALEMVRAINFHRKKAGEMSAAPAFSKSSVSKRPFVVSVDMPSGNSDEWEAGMPVIEADLTLSIEPQKCCNYSPAARPYAGTILPVGGLFPPDIFARYTGAELLTWENVRGRIAKIRPDAYKNERGAVELRAGSTGAAGAALIAARGAQAAGAGLVRLVADDELYPVLASQLRGVMVIPAGLREAGTTGFSSPDALLLGPGWGKKPERAVTLKNALALEKKGVPLVLDADAIEPARDTVFNGNTILTPHPGEFSVFSGIDKKDLLSRPVPALLKYARERNAVILFKGHVITIAAPDGRLGIVDGMAPGLAAGGSGDLLAGFCAGIAGRMAKKAGAFDAYTCAAAAAALLIAAGKSEGLKRRFTDPVEIAGKAADLAGEAWLDFF